MLASQLQSPHGSLFSSLAAFSHRRPAEIEYLLEHLPEAPSYAARIPVPPGLVTMFPVPKVR